MFYLMSVLVLSFQIIQVGEVSWLVSDVVNDTSGFLINNKKTGLVTLPKNGWQFSNDGWKDDYSLELTGI